MDYIINPWWFYWMNVVDKLSWVFWIIVVILGAVVCFGVLMLIDNEIRFRHFIYIVIAFMISVLLGVFTPSKETLVEMQISKFATYKNAEQVVKIIDKKTDELIDAISNHKDKENEDDD